MLDDGELIEFFLALPVVGEGVVGFVDPFEGPHGVVGAVESGEAGSRS